MQSFLKKIAELDFGWNEVSLTEEGFFELCQRLGIVVKVVSQKKRGFYSCRKNKHYISVSNKLRGDGLLMTLYHELGHYIMHSPSTDTIMASCDPEITSRDEQEANAFAYCALLPLSLLKSRPGEELAGSYGIVFFMERLKVYERYGI